MLSLSQVAGLVLAVLVLCLLGRSLYRDGFQLLPGALWFDGQPEQRVVAAGEWGSDRPVIRAELRVVPVGRRSVRWCRFVADAFTAVANRIEEHDAAQIARMAPPFDVAADMSRMLRRQVSPQRRKVGA